MGDPIKILLVDDRPENLLAMEAVLQSSEYQIISAGSGQEALRWVLKEEFAVILLDVQMPGLNGFDTAQLIRSREKSRNTPIIFITANHQPNEHVIQGYALGAIDYLFKPVDPEALKYKLTAFVHLHQYKEQLELLVEHRTQELLQINEQLRQEIEFRKQSQGKLSQLAAIVDSTDDAIISLDLEGKVTSWNSGAERLYGYTEEEMLGQLITLLAPDTSRREMLEVIENIKLGRRIKYFETIRKRKDGRLIDISLSGCPIVDENDRITSISTIGRDISQRKQMEQEMLRLDRYNLIGEMAAGISHEVRNPMTTVRGFLQMMQGKTDCKKYKGYFSLMIEELDRTNSIITEFLSISKNKPTELEKQSINSVIKSLLPLMQADALVQEKYVQTALQDVPELFLNSKEIRQVILNLCRNGLEAMSPGGCLTIGTYQETGQVILEIQDEGGGIPPEVLVKIGTPFFTTKPEGTGLGLSICYSIAARHQATIDVRTANQGTTFFVRFPAINN